jgi:hypothetical protein
VHGGSIAVHLGVCLDLNVWISMQDIVLSTNSLSVGRPRNGWITRRWSFGPLLPRFLQEREEDTLTKSTVLFIPG